jgi:hypothetical protein
LEQDAPEDSEFPVVLVQDAVPVLAQAAVAAEAVDAVPVLAQAAVAAEAVDAVRVLAQAAVAAEVVDAVPVLAQAAVEVVDEVRVSAQAVVAAEVVDAVPVLAQAAVAAEAVDGVPVSGLDAVAAEAVDGVPVSGLDAVAAEVVDEVPVSGLDVASPGPAWGEGLAEDSPVEPEDSVFRVCPGEVESVPELGADRSVAREDWVFLVPSLDVDRARIGLLRATNTFRPCNCDLENQSVHSSGSKDPNGAKAGKNRIEPHNG